jgi:hypothetical protein
LEFPEFEQVSPEVIRNQQSPYSPQLESEEVRKFEIDDDMRIISNFGK